MGVDTGFLPQGTLVAGQPCPGGPIEHNFKIAAQGARDVVFQKNRDLETVLVFEEGCYPWLKRRIAGPAKGLT